MTNKQLLEKLKEDMEMRGFSHWTKGSYYRKAKEITEYFGKPMKQVKTKELRDFLLKHLKQEKLDYYGEKEYLRIKENFDELIAKMYNKEWVSYCKPPFKDASCVIRYLGRYTHRVAISNNRIIKEENGEVTFKYRDYIFSSKILYEFFLLLSTVHLLFYKFFVAFQMKISVFLHKKGYL